MVWKINKYKRSERQGRVNKQKQVLEKQVLECQPKLKSCLKTRNDLLSQKDLLNESYRSQDGLINIKAREVSSKSSGSRGNHSWNSNPSVGSKSKGSGSTLSFTNKKRVASVDQVSESERSWDHESRRSETSRKSETCQSTQTSERSTADSRSHIKEAKKKKVYFSSIYIRDYERVVGDNPSCTIGPPVGIGWNYGETRVHNIEYFESMKGPYQKSASYLILSREEREALLLTWGASFHDIVESVRSNLKIKNQRRQTVTNLGKIERIEEAFESATRKLKSALMLRRSTGNKVKRLQEQANLAQSALASLKIAEDRAMSEISGNNCHDVEEPKSQDDFNGFPIPQYGPPPIEESNMRRPHVIIPEEDDQLSKRFSLTGNSTTQSELEIERFYLELELEMFGDEGLPSMVGQTLEVPLKHDDKNHLRNDIGFRSDDVSVNSGISDKQSRDGLDDELLEKEQNQAMISQILLDDAENEAPKFNHSQQERGEQDNNHYYPSSHPTRPLQMDHITRQNRSEWNPSNSCANGASTDMEYEEPYHSQQQTVPLHAGMTMFEDCALLGGRSDRRYSNGSSHGKCRGSRRRSSRKKDLNAGPKVQFLPPPTHLTPSHWMDGSDPHIIPSRAHETITIFEDHFSESFTRYGSGIYSYNNNLYPSNSC